MAGYQLYVVSSIVVEEEGEENDIRDQIRTGVGAVNLLVIQNTHTKSGSVCICKVEKCQFLCDGCKNPPLAPHPHRHGGGCRYGTWSSGVGTGHRYGTWSSGVGTGHRYGTWSSGVGTGHRYGTWSSGVGTGHRYGTWSSGVGTGHRYGTWSSGVGTGYRYGTWSSGVGTGYRYGTWSSGVGTGQWMESVSVCDHWRSRNNLSAITGVPITTWVYAQYNHWCSHSNLGVTHSTITGVPIATWVYTCQSFQFAVLTSAIHWASPLRKARTFLGLKNV